MADNTQKTQGSDVRVKALDLILKSIEKVALQKNYRNFRNLADDEFIAKTIIDAMYEIDLISIDEKQQFEDSLEQAIFKFQKRQFE